VCVFAVFELYRSDTHTQMQKLTSNLLCMDFLVSTVLYSKHTHTHTNTATHTHTHTHTDS